MKIKSVPALALLAALCLFAVSCVTTAALPSKFSGATPIEWSQRLAISQINRPQNPPKWDYTVGLFCLSLLKLDQIAPDPRYLKYSEQAVGSLVSPDGKIQGYKVQEFQLDALNPAKTLLALWHITHQEKYQAAARLLRRQLDSQPRTYDGGFWHKERYTNQMWLDGLYMAAPFYAECAQVFGEPAASSDDVALQIRLMDEHTYDAASGLNFHGWDAAKVQPWANPATGCSSNFWGRAEGWYVMALVDVLDYFPTNHPARAQLITTLQKTAKGIVKWQDAQTGLWWQVMDAGDRKGNYLEATASAMFVYALAKGVNHGYLPAEYAPAVTKGYAGIIKKFLRDDGGGQWSLTQCCSVAGLGFKNAAGHPRDGTFDYYVSEPVVNNDLKGVGPFILAGIEVQRLAKAP